MSCFIQAKYTTFNFANELAKEGVKLIVSDDHAGLKAARRAVLPSVPWQRCQFHLAQNAIHHAPNAAIRKRIGAELRNVWNAATRDDAEQALNSLVAAYRSNAADLAIWLERNVPEGLTVFAFPEGLHAYATIAVLAMVLVPGLLMVSTIRFRSFKSFDLGARRTYPVLILVAGAIALLVAQPKMATTLTQLHSHFRRAMWLIQLEVSRHLKKLTMLSKLTQPN